MVIHIISTVNGLENEGMRNVATHLAREFETENTVLYSGLKQIPTIIVKTIKSDVTMIFARSNKLMYELTKIVTKLCKHVWIVMVQKPDANFIALNDKSTLKCNYLSIMEADVADIKVAKGKHKRLFSVGINVEKFAPASPEKRADLKKKYGYPVDRPLVIHVGHCSVGRGLEDFAKIDNAERLVVASGMFEDTATVKTLLDAGVNIHNGFLKNIEEIYQMADVYLFPTRNTEFVISIPLSVMEALSCGVPVIGYKDFKNINEISASEGAVTLINSVDELNSILPEIIERKSDNSLLYNTSSWSKVAVNVLKILKEEIR